MKKNSHHKQAVTLRRKGWSYNVIIQRLGVSKSTLSNWLSDIPYVPNAVTLTRIKNGPAKSAEKRRKQKVNNILTLHKAASEELGKISWRDLWMMGIGLYIGEGSKKFEEVRIVNSNPQVIRLMVLWLIRVCKVPKSNLQLRLYAYPDTDIKRAIKFWLSMTGLSSESLAKVHIDERKNKKAKKWKQLPNGTLHIIVRSWGNKSLGVTLHRRISGWIETFYNKAGVV